MLHILGAGYASPETRISNKFLAEIGLGAVVSEFQAGSVVESRSTVLPLEYIRETKNNDPREASRVALESPTTLALKAAQMALERAGITSQQISCIIGESSTPFQSTPSEAQRVGERLGIKVPAFDVAACSGPIPLHLDLLSSLRPEKVPEYCLCIVAQTPTCRVDYSKGIGAFFLGDEAAALVVSAKHTGKISVGTVNFKNDLASMAALQLDSYTHVHFDRQSMAMLDCAARNALADAMQRCHADPAKIKIIAHQFEKKLENEEINGTPLSSQKFVADQMTHGWTLSAGPTATLGRHWEEFKSGETLICTYAGAGLSYGNAILEVMKG